MLADQLYKQNSRIRHVHLVVGIHLGFHRFLALDILPFGNCGVQFRFSNDTSTDSGVACIAVTGVSGMDSMAENCPR